MARLKFFGARRPRAPLGSAAGRGERGYTLVALLAVMTIMALFLTAVAPSIRQQAQREREQEAIFRGEEVAAAILRFNRHHKRLPNSMDELLEGIPSGTKKVQILRPAAARDPLSDAGEWKQVRPNDPTMIEFARAVTLHAGGATPVTSDPELQRMFGARFISILNTGTKEAAPGGEDNSENSTGPFIGVVSRSRRDSVITYYGIERHDRWVFTPLFK